VKDDVRNSEDSDFDVAFGSKDKSAKRIMNIEEEI
jgi:hypothetical protein